VAKEKGLPILKHHLLPRPKGFNLVASQLEGHVKHLYDFNIAAKDINGRQPTMVDVQNGVPVHVMVLYRRIPMTEVPKNDEKQTAVFLNKLFTEKVATFCFLLQW
jgi:lysophosphatidic acid acyltransferase/lysophosphatidylinositol acyltransferase